jgi:hypothetical protein
VKTAAHLFQFGVPLIVAAFVLAGSRSVEGQADWRALLTAAGSHTAAHSKTPSAIVFEESYHQHLVRPEPYATGERRMRSRMIAVSADGYDWIGRDVIEVDDRVVQIDTTRFEDLFAPPAPLAEAIARARAIALESTGLTLGPPRRPLNYPTFALRFITPGLQERSSFSMDGRERTGGSPAVVLRFHSSAGGAVLGFSGANIKTSGRLWLEADTGQVLRSRVTFEESDVASTYDVTFAASPASDTLVPIRMIENVTLRVPNTLHASEFVRGEASYSGFRRLRIDSQIDQIALPGSGF